MRLSSQNNQFRFCFPQDFIEDYMLEQFDKLMVKNFVMYDNSTDYINSTIMEINLPGMSFDTSEQITMRGKKIGWKESGNIMDKLTREFDVTMRSVDSFCNYFMMQQIVSEFYENTGKHQIPIFILQILDKDGDLIYTITFKEIIIKSLSEVRLGYNAIDLTQQTFSLTFQYNFINIYWELDDNDTTTSTSIFDIPIKWKPGSLDTYSGNVPYKNLTRGPQNSGYTVEVGDNTNAI